jgi:hypothetical protein
VKIGSSGQAVVKNSTEMPRNNAPSNPATKDESLKGSPASETDQPRRHYCARAMILAELVRSDATLPASAASWCAIWTQISTASRSEVV